MSAESRQKQQTLWGCVAFRTSLSHLLCVDASATQAEDEGQRSHGSQYLKLLRSARYGQQKKSFESGSSNKFQSSI